MLTTKRNCLLFMGFLNEDVKKCFFSFFPFPFSNFSHIKYLNVYIWSNLKCEPEERDPLLLSSIKATSLPRLFVAVHWIREYNTFNIRRDAMKWFPSSWIRFKNFFNYIWTRASVRAIYLVLSKVPLLSLLNNQLACGQRPSLSDGDDLMVVSISGQLLALKQKQSFQRTWLKIGATNIKISLNETIKKKGILS